ncbi:MAG: hypothetical protein HKN26_08455, partial [Acidimicrobiales bacterium]|nr:hypothetical protein [Acidimicrobiales bacterium]
MSAPLTSRFSLRARLALLLAAMLLVLGGVAWLLYGNTADRLETQAEETLLARADALAAVVNDDLVAMGARVESIAGHLARAGTTDPGELKASIDQLLSDPIMNNGNVRSIVVFDSQFSVVAVAGRRPELTETFMSVALNNTNYG